MVTRSLIEISSLDPRLIGVAIELVAVHDLVDAQHAVVDEAEAAGLRAVAPDVDAWCRRESMASITLRQRAAGAFSRPPNQVPCGP